MSNTKTIGKGTKCSFQCLDKNDEDHQSQDIMICMNINCTNVQTQEVSKRRVQVNCKNCEPFQTTLCIECCFRNTVTIKL